MKELRDYVDKHRKQHVVELVELLSVPSVSTDPSLKAQTERCAQLVARRMEEAGLQTRIFPTPGHPVVCGERLRAPGKPTVLIYGHYDVQPPDPVELWRHGPFEPTVEDGYLVARGATDDKGQFYALLKGVEATLKTRGELPVNVKVLCEGEEEVGSPNLLPFVRAERQRLRADVVFISDSSQFGIDMPAITYGLKGLVYLEAVVRGPAKDLHSGSFGGSVSNPANVLAQMLAACQGPFGRVAIPGFYDDVLPLADWERKEFAALPFSEEEFRKETGVPRLFGEEGYTTLERKWARPTFDVNGLLSGFTGQGAKTVLPAVARAKFSMRLVPKQDPVKVAKLASDFLREVAPPTVSVEILSHHGAKPVLVSRQGKAVQAAERALEAAFGRRPFFVREGGSIPVVITFQEELGVESLLVGFGQSDDNAHSPNERFRLEDFHRGIVTLGAFLEEYGKS
jgi:acetylornithine deacetylase/succinyl-diaminopimelate desuccinylase-like protein